MPVSEEQRSAMLSASREAASALLEDVAHINAVLATKHTSRSELRMLSATLRRLIVERVLGTIAAPRIGRFDLTAPDNKPYYALEKNGPYKIFVSGGAPLFGPMIRPVAVKTNPPLNAAVAAKEALIVGDMRLAEATVSLRLDNFGTQRVMCLNGQWVSRSNVIKFVANAASGVHSYGPTSDEEIVLAKLRNAVFVKSNGTEVTVTINDVHSADYSQEFAHAPDAIDIVLHELLSAAHYLAISPALVVLQEVIRKELR